MEEKETEQKMDPHKAKLILLMPDVVDGIREMLENEKIGVGAKVMVIRLVLERMDITEK